MCCVCGTQLADLQLIPDKCNKDLTELTKQLDDLHTDKQKEEEHLKEVMDSFKSETEVRISHTVLIISTIHSMAILCNIFSHLLPDICFVLLLLLLLLKMKRLE